ncbi:MAG: DNA mismatch repair protein MutS [Clostridia bacterium]|nr:DNA mismatch repair protein MutS [Clostridia bacterium]
MALSPMMSHYLTIKDKYKDCIVFYRLGDFYEMFFDDAVKASDILGLTLTGRDCGLSERAPMCGVPFHAADLYISKLVAAGEKVAICEQMTEPNGKELVERKVIRIVSAGTVINDELIDAKANNFLLALYVSGKSAAISWTDITTGEFFAKSFTQGDVFADLFNELVRVSPAEIISNREAEEKLSEAPVFAQGVLPKINAFTESEFEPSIASSTLKEQLNVKSLDAFGFNGETDISVVPCGALIAYLKETQKNLLYNINSVKILNEKEFMMLDQNAIRNLELVKTLRDGKRYGSLLWVLDKTKTSMGARLLTSWILSPLADINKINYRLNGVESFYNNTLIRQSLTDILSTVKDVGRLTGKISNGNLLPKDCVALSKSLAVIPSIKFQLSGIDNEYVSDIIEKLSDYTDVVALLDRAIADDGADMGAKGKNGKPEKYIKDGYNSELDDLRALASGGRNALQQIEDKERERTGIKTLRVSYNRVFGYFIEITNSFKDKVPYDYIRKQTLAGSERYITEDLKALEEKILTAVERAENLELRLFNEIKTGLTAKVAALQETSEAIAELDALISLATVAREKGFVKPKIAGYGETLYIKDGRHPVVEAALKQRFVPNDCLLDSGENRTMIITGPNMAGKSTYMRQIAIITVMAHIGSFVPATEATIPLVDKVFTRIGASDSLINDQSTFMVEMSEVANIVKNATENSLLILDEVGRGTSTYDGLSIAWAALEYLTEKVRAKTLFATHYHELTELEGVIDGVKNYKVSVKEMPSGVIFLRKITRGGANKSFGIEVAVLAGVGEEITNRAKNILKKLENQHVAPQSGETKPETAGRLSETERIIKEIDLNNLSPMQAFNIVSELNEKLRGRDE